MKNSIFPKDLQILSELVASFPGIGRKNAGRIVLHLLNLPQENQTVLGNIISSLNKNVSYCPICHYFSTNGICPICSDESRDKKIICVVENYSDIFALESSGFTGTYHILGGVISPLKGIGIEELNIPSLINRAANANEIILALGLGTEGEITMQFLYDELTKNYSKLSISRLAYGIPAGAELEYCDAKTLRAAINNRTIL
jgi:recombination protein RecR